MIEQRLAVAAPHRPRQRRQVFVEAAEHLQHGVLVGEEHVAPHGRIGRRDPREVAEAAGRELQHLGSRHLGKLIGGADDGVGDQMRQMAGDAQHQVMVVGRHGFDIGAELPPERRELLDRRFVGVRRRRQDAPAVDEQFGEAEVGAGMLGARDRVRRDEMHMLRQVRGHVPHHRAFDRADVGHGRALHQMRADLLGHVAAGADRNADDDQVGAFDRGGVALDHLIDHAQFGHALAGLRRACRGDDRAHRALGAGGARDRAADQAETDQCQAVEDRLARFAAHLAAHLDFPRNSASAFTTSRFASSVPTDMRSAWGSL